MYKKINNFRTTAAIKSLSTALFIMIVSTASIITQAQPAHEIGCFRNFNVNAAGRNDVNAYLLSQLAYLVYADNLAKQIAPRGEVEALAKRLQENSAEFKQEFIKKTGHFFYEPFRLPLTVRALPRTNPSKLRLPPFVIEPALEFDFVTSGDRAGIDPETMLISTRNAVFVVVRGTDRVGGANSDFKYKWGEWLQTDALAFLGSPCSGCETSGNVHRGFRDALGYNDSAGRSYIRTLTQKIKNMVGQANKKVWITGHSLGGAMAQLIGFYLKQQENITAQQIVVFSSPHPGDSQFAGTLNSLFPNGRIQRYEFIDDPVTRLPGRYMGYGRAGVRNHASKVTAIRFNAGERSGNDFGNIAAVISSGLLSFGGACFHHPEWLVNSAYNVLSRTRKSQMPLPPALPTAEFEACLSIDINLGTSGNYIDPGSATIEPGTYTIKNARSGKFLIASKESCPFNLNNCCPVIQRSSSVKPNDNKWIIAAVDGAFVTSYTIKNRAYDTVLDADIICAGSNNCKVQNCNRIGFGDRRNQEWAFVRMSNGNYKLRCVRGNKYLRLNPDCAENNNCGFLLYEYLNQSDEEFILQRL